MTTSFQKVHDSLNLCYVLSWRSHLLDYGLHGRPRPRCTLPRHLWIGVVGPVADAPKLASACGGDSTRSQVTQRGLGLASASLTPCDLRAMQSISWPPSVSLHHPVNGIVVSRHDWLPGRTAGRVQICGAARSQNSSLRTDRVAGPGSIMKRCARLARGRKPQRSSRKSSTLHGPAIRAGTHEQAIRRCGLRRCRYIGQAKTRLQHILTATAVNLVRLNDWWAAKPLAKTRCSHFGALAQAA